MASKSTTTWAPLDIFSPNRTNRTNHQPFAIIILNQDLKLPLYIYNQLWLNSSFIVAADGGANRLYNLNKDLPLNAIIGDLDSLTPSTRSFWESKGIPVIHNPDQYSTDFTKAVHYIHSSSPSRWNIDIVVLGGLGGRVDQGLSVLHHLYLFQEAENYKAGRMYLLSSEAVTFVLKSGRHEIKAKERWGIEGGEVGLGKHVGILPLKGESVISTKGLEWDVTDWKTGFGGLVSTSNHVKESIVEVETSVDVLFTVDLDYSEGGGREEEGGGGDLLDGEEFERI